MTDREKIRKAFSPLHASAATMEEVYKRMEQEKKGFRRTGGRLSAVLLAAVLVLALGITAFAAVSVFSLGWKQAENGEAFTVQWQGGPWESSLVLRFDGPETASRIRFRPGYLPSPATYTYPGGRDGWYSRLSTEHKNPGGAEQPCLIEVYYAPMFLNGGSLILLNGEAGEIQEERWEDYQVLKFETVYEYKQNDTQVSRQVDGSYVLLFQPEEGYLIVVSGQSPLAELERVARELEVEPTEELISAGDYEDQTAFIDWGIG